jgi:hypothetical protein
MTGTIKQPIYSKLILTEGRIVLNEGYQNNKKYILTVK